MPKIWTPQKHVENKTCAKCSEKDPDHVEEDCMKETKFAGKIIRLMQDLVMLTRKGNI